MKYITLITETFTYKSTLNSNVFSFLYGDILNVSWSLQAGIFYFLIKVDLLLESIMEFRDFILFFNTLLSCNTALKAQIVSLVYPGISLIKTKPGNINCSSNNDGGYPVCT